MSISSVIESCVGVYIVSIKDRDSGCPYTQYYRYVWRGAPTASIKGIVKGCNRATIKGREEGIHIPSIIDIGSQIFIVIIKGMESGCLCIQY